MASQLDSGETLSNLRAGDLACAISDETVSEEMLESYAQEDCLDVPDEDGQTPLMLACLAGLEDVVKFLLANGANPNSKSLKEANTPLQYACMVADTTEDELSEWMTRKVSIVKLLLSYGALEGFVDVPDKDGQTPLMLACLQGVEEFVKLLLANGANPNSKSLKEANTPMHYACMVADTTEEESLNGRDYKLTEWMTTKFSIVKLLLSYGALEGCIDVPNKDGKTPLMLACLEGLEEVVKFLLANGANPNSKSLKEANTPLHYACMVEGITEEESLNSTEWMTTKVSIVKLLLSSGALAVQNNLNGWSPPCFAALHKVKDVVDLFLAMHDDDIPLGEKIKAAEIFGWSLATLDHTLDYNPMDSAFHYFCRAITLQQHAGFCKGQPETSEIAARFSKINLKEFHTLDEIRSIELSENETQWPSEKEIALKAHAFLVGESLFPTTLKQKYFFPCLTEFASLVYHDASLEENMDEGAFQIFSCILGFERNGELQLGYVAGYLLNFYLHARDFADRQHAIKLLCAYDSVLYTVRIESLLDTCNSLMDSFGGILFLEACSGVVSFDMLKSTLKHVEQLVRIIQGRTRRESPDDYPRMPSVLLQIMNRLMRKYRYGGISRLSLLRVKLVLLRVLSYDNASYQDGSRNNTLLHKVAYCVYQPEHMGDSEDLARAFVRHGCPLDAVNINGETARDTLKNNSHRWNVDPFQTLLSPPTTVLRLEEAAARVVLRHKINYQALPQSLRDVVEGGVSESALESLENEILKTSEDENE